MGHVRLIVRVLVLVTSAAAITGCKKSPSGPSDPPPPPVGELVLTRPADVRVEDVTTQTWVVTYPALAHTGGVEPISVICAPASGSAFSLGTTTVTCTAADAGTPARTATTSFSVTLVAFVPPVPDLRVTKFMAFGDSITSGTIGDLREPPSPCDPGAASHSSSLFLRPMYQDRDDAYPSVVYRLLQQRYTRQTFTMINEGIGGHSAVEDYTRFRDAVDAHQPQAVLLLQGILDVRGKGQADAPIEALQTDVRSARDRGVQHVFLGTLPPVAGGNLICGALENSLIRETNNLIRNLAAAEGAYLVDPYPVLAANVELFQGADGLHPSKEGQQVIGGTFFEEIKKRLELPPTSVTSSTGSAPSALSRPHVQVGSPAQRQPVRVPKRQQ